MNESAELHAAAVGNQLQLIGTASNVEARRRKRGQQRRVGDNGRWLVSVAEKLHEADEIAVSTGDGERRGSAVMRECRVGSNTHFDCECWGDGGEGDLSGSSMRY